MLRRRHLSWVVFPRPIQKHPAADKFQEPAAAYASATANRLSGSPGEWRGRGFHHDDEEYLGAVPTAHPTNPPTVDAVTQRHRMEQSQELGCHGSGLLLGRCGPGAAHRFPSRRLQETPGPVTVPARFLVVGEPVPAERHQSRPRPWPRHRPVSYTHLRAHETRHDL